MELTKDQIVEFQGVIDSLKGYRDMLPTLKEIGDAEGGFKLIKELPERTKTIEAESKALQAKFDQHLRQGIGARAVRPPLLTGQSVSDECARHLAAIYIVAAANQGQLDRVGPNNRDFLMGHVRDRLGIEVKYTPLTTSEIPLPTEYQAEVVALLGEYGTARRFGTVFPLGTGTVKLPRMSTNPAFGLLTMSSAVTSKAPAFAPVTFAAEKFGGLVVLPSEIEEDSIVAMGQFIAWYCAYNMALVEDQVFWMNLDAATYGAVGGLCASTITNSKITQMAGTKTHYSDLTLAHLRDVRSVPDAGAIRRGAYFMHPTFEKHLAGLNTAGDKPYNPQAQIAGRGTQPFTTGPTLDGFPINWIDMLPAFTTGVNVSKVCVLFGDPRYQYLGLRGGVRFDVSREAAFITDETCFRAIERFTIGLMATGAVAGIETAAA